MASFAITEAATAAPAGSRRGAPRWLIAYMYILPATLIMAAITYWPILFQVYMSFTDYGLRNLRFDAPAPNFVGLQNFIDLITNGITVIPNFSFWGMLAFNLFWTFSNVIFHVTIGILIAVVLNTPGLRFRGFYRAIFILPIVVPTLVVATVWRNMFDTDYGAINQGLRRWPLAADRNTRDHGVPSRERATPLRPGRGLRDLHHDHPARPHAPDESHHEGDRVVCLVRP